MSELNLEQSATAGYDLSQAADYSVTPTNYLDIAFLDTYLREKYKEDANVHVLPTTHQNAFDLRHFTQMYGPTALTDEERSIITDIAIPFHGQPYRHFMGLHVKHVYTAGSKDPVPVISWIDSLGSSMPASVRKSVDEIWTHKNKVVNEQVIKHAQQKEGHNCGVYTAINLDEMINGKGLKSDFKTLSETALNAKRKEMVDVVNKAPQTQHQYTFDASPRVEHAISKSLAAEHVEKSWSQEKFVDNVSKDLLDFGASLQGSGTAQAFDDFDAAFDIAAKAYQEALQKSSVASNPHAFFNTYQGLSQQLENHYEHNKQAVVEASKTCAQEAQEDILEEGNDFFRRPGSTFA